MAIRATLFTALLMASSSEALLEEYESTDTEYVVRKYVGTVFPPACRNAPSACAKPVSLVEITRTLEGGAPAK